MANAGCEHAVRIGARAIAARPRNRRLGGVESSSLGPCRHTPFRSGNPNACARAGHILVKVSACGVCRTDLHIADGELTEPKLPLVPGHQIVGTVVEMGKGVDGMSVGQRVGVPWLGSTCGKCEYCASGRENLCLSARFTGYDVDGGFAEYAVADARFAFPLPEGLPDLQVAPLLCGGLIGYRALRMAGEAKRIGFYGFGSAAHILAQVCKHQGREVYAFTRPGDAGAKALAIRVGAIWAGTPASSPPRRWMRPLSSRRTGSWSRSPFKPLIAAAP